MLGRFLAEPSYGPIRNAFHPANVTAEELSVDAGWLTSRDMDCAAAILDWHGVVVLRNFVSPALVDAAHCEAEALTACIEKAIAAPQAHGQTGNIFWQVDGARFRSHNAILAHGRPLANLSKKNGTPVGGVIDLFFLDLLARERGWDALAACCDSLKDGAIAQIVAAVSPARPRQVNMLRNDSVTATRGLHVDNLRGNYKAVLYLSDVRGMGDGPYAYVPGSQRRRDLLRREARLNSLNGRSETDSYAFQGHEIAFPVPKGSVIISCQSGVHRGMPQRFGASHTILVGNYRV